jgi:hypothetical protein
LLPAWLGRCFANQAELILRLLQLSARHKENDMEHDLRPINVIRADLARAKDVLAALGSDNIGGTVHFFARNRVKRLTDELCVAEATAERLAEVVALKWISRYARVASA